MPDAAAVRALTLFVRGRLGNHADGDDVVQETYARLLSYQASSPVANVKALCFSIARNLLIDHYRSSRRADAVALDEQFPCRQPSPDVVLAYRRGAALMARALERMPPLRREIFFRRRLDDVATADIAAALQMSVAAVEKHVTRAMRDLRTTLARRGFTIEDGA